MCGGGKRGVRVLDKESSRGGAHSLNRAIGHKIHFKVDRPTGSPPDLPDLEAFAAERIKITGRTAWGSNTVIYINYNRISHLSQICRSGLPL